MSTNSKTLALGCDHAGFPHKQAVLDTVLAAGWEILDFGTHSPESVDYPDFVHPVVKALEEERAGLGILLCGSGNGVAITANRSARVRAAVCWEESLAELARAHNDANVLALPVRYITEDAAKAITRTFLQTAFEGGRHARRVEKINC